MTTERRDGTDDELRELYRELILDHARQPRHFGRLAAPTHKATGYNPLCGDKLTLELALDEQGLICDAGFEGSGCAISLASASLMTEAVIGQPQQVALDCAHDLNARLTGKSGESNEAAVEFDKLRALEGVRDFPARVKCATLAWHALESAINQTSANASSE